MVVRATLSPARTLLNAQIQDEIAWHGPQCCLNHLDISGVDDMSELFHKSPFNGDISRWNVAHVMSMESMFEAGSFNGDISGWDVSNVKTMHSMFRESRFNGDLSRWNTSRVENMGYMFANSSFVGDISQWNVGSALDMYNMFESAAFSGDLSQWDMGRVEYVQSIFYLSPFNGDISQWDLRDARASLMLDTVHFQSPLPKLSLRCPIAVANAGYTGDARSLLNVDHATRVFGSKKRLDTHLAATIGAGLNHLHIERIVQLSNKPSWCSKAAYEEAKAVASMCNAMGVDKTEWAAHAYRSYCARREVSTREDALADFSFE